MSSNAALIEEIQSLLLYEHQRLTPATLALMIRTQMPHSSRTSIRAAIQSLINEGILRYTSHFSTSHLEINFDRPVPVSQRIVLVPGHRHPEGKQDAIFVKIAAGDAFGVGDHPTTRLALQAVDWVLAQVQRQDTRNKIALDVGTGSGVLAIAAVKLGIASVLGIDSDPVARYEAQANVHLNALDQRIVIAETLREHAADKRFDLIMANLRLPTLMTLFPMLKGRSMPKAYWVLSGFRPDEQDRLMQSLPPDEFSMQWQRRVLNWAAIALHRNH